MTESENHKNLVIAFNQTLDKKDAEIEMLRSEVRRLERREIEARLEEVVEMPHSRYCSSYLSYGSTSTAFTTSVDLGVGNPLQFNCDCHKSVRVQDLKSKLADLDARNPRSAEGL